jgi:hypothetical protein
MTRFVVGDDRSQSTLFPERLNDYLGEDNPVRAIDVREVARGGHRRGGSATFRGFARSAHFRDQGRAPLLSAINNLHDRVDVALR